MRIAKFSEIVDVIKIISISCFFAKAITGNDIFLYIGFFSGILLFIYQLLSRNSISLFAVIFFLIVIFTSVFSLLNNGFKYGLLFIPSIIAASGIGWRISTNGINYRYCWLLFYGSLMYFLVHVLLLDQYAGSVFAYSRNHISIYFINATCLLFIASYQSKQEIKLTPVIATLFVSILSVGFGGILSSALFLYMILYYKFFNKLKNYKSLFFLVMGFSLFILIMFLNSFLIYIIENFDLSNDMISKLQSPFNFSEGVRFHIFNEYIEKLNFQRIIFGTNMGETFYNQSNLHSAFLMLHSRSGILFFLLIILFSYSLLMLYKHNFVFATCFFVILFRGLTDTSFLVGSPFDFIFIFFLLYAIYPIYRVNYK